MKEEGERGREHGTEKGQAFVKCCFLYIIDTHPIPTIRLLALSYKRMCLVGGSWFSGPIEHGLCIRSVIAQLPVSATL